jgi:hypothetical protein
VFGTILIKRSILIQFHVKTETLYDEQYYYKIVETRMDQFGLNMNFLEIKQVLAIIFTLKINFYIHLVNFPVLWTARQLPKRTGSLAQNIQRLRTLYYGLWVYFLERQGLL